MSLFVSETVSKLSGLLGKNESELNKIEEFDEVVPCRKRVFSVCSQRKREEEPGKSESRGKLGMIRDG